MIYFSYGNHNLEVLISHIGSWAHQSTPSWKRRDKTGEKERHMGAEERKTENNVGDFGFATNTYTSPFLQTFCGSYAYCSPEILRGERYRGPASDVWSMGVVLYALVCSRLPFSDDDLRFIMKNQPRKMKFSKKTSQEEEIFPKNVTPLRGNEKEVTCLTSPIVSLPVTLTFDKGRRRHTLAGHTKYETSKRRVSLRDELLRTIAAKEMKSKSSQMLADVKRKSMSLENVKKMNESKHIRRNSLVHDIIHIDHEATRERRMSMTNRKPSLVADVVYTPPSMQPRQQPQRLQFLDGGLYTPGKSLGSPVHSCNIDGVLSFTARTYILEKTVQEKYSVFRRKKKQKKDLVIIDEEMMNSASSSNTDVVDAIAQVTSETSLIKDEVIQLVKDEVSQIKDDLFQIKDEVTQMKDDVIQQVKDEISQIKHEITSTLNDAAYQAKRD
ncbi:hypothetical protein QZH41_005875 [Actinostola sp. cb2023]|nr:hypothetical protein QZH41_005875 [Actinostola sp. cb2023]